MYDVFNMRQILPIHQFYGTQPKSVSNWSLRLGMYGPEGCTKSLSSCAFDMSHASRNPILSCLKTIFRIRASKSLPYQSLQQANPPNPLCSRVLAPLKMTRAAGFRLRSRSDAATILLILPSKNQGATEVKWAQSETITTGAVLLATPSILLSIYFKSLEQP